MHSNADKGSYQCPNRDPDSADSLHKVNAYSYVYHSFRNSSSRSKVLFSSRDDCERIRVAKLANRVSEHQNLKKQCTADRVAVPDPKLQ